MKKHPLATLAVRIRHLHIPHLEVRTPRKPRDLGSSESRIQTLIMAAIRQLNTQLCAISHNTSIIRSPSQRPSTHTSFYHAVQSVLQTSTLIPAAVRIGLIPSGLAGLWEGLLRAVPKKKTSHRKTRQRFLAGKALQDVTALNRCSACGAVKRAHFLCATCIKGKQRDTPMRVNNLIQWQLFRSRGIAKQARLQQN